MFSVIMPVYNACDYLEQVIADVLNQTFSDFELLLIDDGSTDGSGNLCDFYAKKDARVNVIHQKNAGIAKARNTGIQHAQHAYLYFLDDDDRVSRHLLEDVNHFIMAYQPDLISFGSMIIQIQRGTAIRQTVRNFPFFFCNSTADLMQNYYPNLMDQSMLHCVWDKVYKRECVEKSGVLFDPSYTYGGEDLCFNLMLICHVERMLNTDLLYYRYFLRDIQSTVLKYNPDAFEQGMKLIKKMQQINTLYPNPQNIHTIYNTYCLNIVNAAAQLDRQGAPCRIIGRFHLIKQTIGKDPFDSRFQAQAFRTFQNSGRTCYSKALVYLAIHKHFFLFCLLQKAFSVIKQIRSL